MNTAQAAASPPAIFPFILAYKDLKKHLGSSIAYPGFFHL